MSREIKFRAWDIRNRVMRGIRSLYPAIAQNDRISTIEVWDTFVDETNDYVSESLILEESEYVLMQSIGLRDKNSKEIYEGDILRFREITYLGDVWGEKTFKEPVVWEEDRIKFSCGLLGWHDVRDAMIVGNIYENPELLKE